jgi:glutamate formiminotransferase
MTDAFPKNEAVLTTLSVVQCAINVSEGRNSQTLVEIAAALRAVPNVTLADISADPDHHRAVFSLLGSPPAIHAAVLALARVAISRIDLNTHRGVHPRIGAVDVVPLVPIRGVTMAECVTLAEQIARDLSDELHLPVYLYERSARPGRPAALPLLRKGGFEALHAAPLVGDRAPDFGTSAAHPTAGAVVVGARDPLVAYNLWLAGGTDEAAEKAAAAARRIATALRRERETNPALLGVRALGLWLPQRQRAQVSLNLTRPQATTLPAVFDYVRESLQKEAAQAENTVRIAASEIIGLIPLAVLGGVSPARILWHDARITQILDYWLDPASVSTAGFLR